MSPFLTSSGTKTIWFRTWEMFLNMVPSTELSLVKWPQAGKSSQTDLAKEIKIVLEQF